MARAGAGPEKTRGMKIEFRPEFRIDLKVLWPKLKGAFKGLIFKPEEYDRSSRKAYALLA
jgi:hypothetical protein